MSGDYVSPTLREALTRAGARMSSLGLPKGFLNQFSEEDDWGFILKIHALVDALLQKTITKCCFSSDADEEKILKIVAKMNWQGQMSKLGLAKTFDLVDQRSLEFLHSLNDLRNAYAHKVSNVVSTIPELLSSPESGSATMMRLCLYENDENHLPTDGEGIKSAIILSVTVLTVELLNREDGLRP